ncbi:MAG TPA: RluA family pseudouridine synthase, partial [Clostridia bacterium]|nr:RluA family pseudouridine synthase [Clostridia bacterium]
MNTIEIFKASELDQNKRLDVFLAERSSKSRSHIHRLIEQGLVTVDLRPVKASDRVKPGMSIRVEFPPPEEITPRPQEIPLDIVYEDSDLIVINKPQGMVVHPAAGNHDNTLVNALLHHCDDLSGINGVIRPGIVHRLDKDTSGLMVVAKNDSAHRSLASQIADKTCRRDYLAVVDGIIKNDSGIIDAPIARHKTNRKKMAVIDGGRRAVTHYSVKERFLHEVLVECSLETGRTHQIRVHMAHIGHPCLGDTVYGAR